MVTKEQAITSRVFHLGDCWREVGPRGGVTDHGTSSFNGYTSRGGPLIFRAGAIKTWKRHPERFLVNIHRGMHEHATLDQDDAWAFHVPEDCPLRKLDQMRDTYRAEDPVLL